MVAVAFIDDSSSAYGNARHHRLGDLTGDGATTTDDRNLLLGNSREYGLGDLDRDGEVTSNDLALLDADMGAALPAGQLSAGASGTENIIGYAGYIFNAEIPGAGLYTVRHRHYAPDLGRWLSRDPLGYVDGMSLYEYVYSSPTIYIDPEGLQGTPTIPSDHVPRYGTGTHPNPGLPHRPGGRRSWVEHAGAWYESYMHSIRRRLLRKSVEDCERSGGYPMIVDLRPDRRGQGTRNRRERDAAERSPRFDIQNLDDGVSIRCYDDPCDVVRDIGSLMRSYQRSHLTWQDCLRRHSIAWCSEKKASAHRESRVYEMYRDQSRNASRACQEQARYRST